MSEQTGSHRRIQTWADWQAAVESGNCTEAEKELVAACRAGRPCKLGDGTRPAGPSPARNVGADLLRYLIKGGCDACDLHDLGVDLYGAWITGALDLRLVKAAGVTGMIRCHFELPIEAMNARLDTLNLNGSICPALNAQGAEVKGGVFLGEELVAEGEVSLAGAVIGGQLVCKGGSFENAGGKALNAEGAELKGDVFLSVGFTAEGEVSLAGAMIGGQLSCVDGRFENAAGDALNVHSTEVKGDVFLSEGFAAEGEVRLSGAVIGGQLACIGGHFENAGGDALNAQDAEMIALLWRGVKHCDGSLRLAGATAQNLNDDAASWAMVHRAYLDGFAYQTIHGPLDAKMRLEWLEKARGYDDGFSPQPYEQLASALRRMGRAGTARTIQLEKEKKAAVDWKRRGRERRDELRKLRDGKPKPDNHDDIQDQLNRLWWELKVIPVWHWLLRVLVGFGYAPQRAIWWALGTVLVTGLFYQFVWNFGGIVPNSDVILTSASWAEAIAARPAHPSAYFLTQEVGQHYETYFAFAQAADIFIPLIDFGQERAWTATTATWLGAMGWVAAWGIKAFGWIVTAVGAAAITGIIRRE